MVLRKDASALAAENARLKEALAVAQETLKLIADRRIGGGMYGACSVAEIALDRMEIEAGGEVQAPARRF